MYMIREVLQCEPGKVRELTDKFKAINELIEGMGLEPFRLYSDYTGAPFWTLVLQHEYESLEAAQEFEKDVFGQDAAKAIMAGYHDLLIEGTREIYRVAS